jgi:hypothetical protein
LALGWFVELPVFRMAEVKVTSMESRDAKHHLLASVMPTAELG